MFTKFSGVESERTVSKFRIRKRNFCDVFTYSLKRVREIRKFHVAILQRWWLRNVQKSVIHVQSCFAKINLFLFCHSRCHGCRRCLSSLLLWSRNFSTVVTLRHNSPPYRVQILSSCFPRSGQDFRCKFPVGPAALRISLLCSSKHLVELNRPIVASLCFLTFCLVFSHYSQALWGIIPLLIPYS